MTAIQKLAVATKATRTKADVRSRASCFIVFPVDDVYVLVLFFHRSHTGCKENRPRTLHHMWIVTMIAR